MTGFQPASPAEERRINILFLPFPQYIAATEKTNLSVASTDDTSDQNSSVLHQFQIGDPLQERGQEGRAWNSILPPYASFLFLLKRQVDNLSFHEWGGFLLI